LPGFLPFRFAHRSARLLGRKHLRDDARAFLLGGCVVQAMIMVK
jgi:hypothetical protein